VQLLAEEGIDFERVDYFMEPFDEATIRRLLEKSGLQARAILRTRDPAYAELGLADESVADDVIIAAMVEHPGLIQRPIVERGDRAVLGRPIENVRPLLR
jgi:arsenate reductase